MIVNIRPQVVAKKFNIQLEEEDLISILIAIKPAIDQKLDGVRVVFFPDRESSVIPRRIALQVWKAIEEEIDRLDLVSMEEI